MDETTLLQARSAAQEARQDALQAVEGLESFVEDLFAHEYVTAEESRLRAAKKLESALKVVNTLPHFRDETERE